MININNLAKSIGKKEILSNIDLEIPAGKFIAFIGPNGAGKSTLLSLISRLQTFNVGEIYIDENELKSWSSKELAKKLSILKQTNAYNLKISVRDLVSFGRYPYSKGRLTSEDNAIIDKVLSQMNLNHLSQNNINELSGGQLQRVYIAMILAQDSDYILLDEPLNNLDMNHAQQIMTLLKELVAEEKKTIFIVLHDINFASAYSDYIVAMKNGQIFQVGKTEKIIQESVLSDLYDMQIKVHQIEGNAFCQYFN
ncbi:iron ABC transporter ATP-binding protein [Floricoccus tropicus]|uniref:Iron ABC transporter ATP-binding protein n=1 Tax=Floricoccus tropicus TaxID=1859473 RepID=A0A1E8GKT9_9LACT|nr:ATP-binding cassette domain-containing protein [Floricoccus tropicus]OFI48860.1 iron ABC transporter ATP-binding protein [Floricoccus tropicus]